MQRAPASAMDERSTIAALTLGAAAAAAQVVHKVLSVRRSALAALPRIRHARIHVEMHGPPWTDSPRAGGGGAGARLSRCY